jgi:hypothetical protein
MGAIIRRRLAVASVAAAVLAVAVVAGVGRGGDNGPPEITYIVSTAAPPTDGAAYAREAIENVRGMERFRFQETVTGAGSATDPASGQVAGEVDLANGPADRPKFKSKVKLQTPAGADASVEQLVIDDELHVKNAKQDKFSKSATKPPRGKGKKVGGTEEVDVVDPVMLVLEPVDRLDASAFGAPSDLDPNGNRSVEVSLPQGAKLVLTIDDASRLVRQMVYTNQGRTATFVLSEFGSTEIDIDPPS